MASDSNPSAATTSSDADGRIPRKYWTVAGAGLSIFCAVITILALLAPSDAYLRNRILGQWEGEVYGGWDGFQNGKEVIQLLFRPDGTVNITDGGTSYEATWGIERGMLLWRLKGGANFFSDLAVTFRKISGEEMPLNQESVAFQGDSSFYWPSKKATFRRIGTPVSRP